METRAAIGTAETPAEPISGLILPLEMTYKSLPMRSPQIVARTKPARPRTTMSKVFVVRKVVPTAVAPTEMPRNNVTMFISAFCAVSLKRSVTPHSRKRLPNIRLPRSGATDGKSKDTTMVTRMGKIIFSFLLTLRVACITVIRSFLVVSNFINGGCKSGISAIYEYAATAIGASKCGARDLVRKIAVGPSAPAIMEIEDASPPVNPNAAARISTRYIPPCAAAPRISELGRESIGPKSVIAPTPIKMRQG